MQVTIWGALWKFLTSGYWWVIFLTGVNYVVATTEGSVYMMRVLIKKGK